MMTDIGSIKEYIKVYPPMTQKLLKEIYAVVKKMMPKAEEAMRYGMPTFRINNKNIVHFAAYKGHIGFYPAPSGIKAFQKELDKAGYKWSKGAVQFPLDKPLPLPLIKKIVLHRLKEQSDRL